MRIENADSRDYDFYEIHVLPNTEKEFDKIWDKLEDQFDLGIEDWNEGVDVISISVDKIHFETKEEFIKYVKKIIRG